MFEDFVRKIKPASLNAERTENKYLEMNCADPYFTGQFKKQIKDPESNSKIYFY
jgi:hypothetical protein